VVVGRRAVRVLGAVVSAVVLGLTGYGWYAYRSLDSALATSNVLGGTRPPDGATDILVVRLDSRTDGTAILCHARSSTS